MGATVKLGINQKLCTGQKMAKPRIFVSSTYYDLKHIRTSLEAFIDGLGYEAVLFESGDVVFKHDQSPDESCYEEIQTCHMLVLIVGGRYGSPATDSEKPSDKEVTETYKRFNSITRKEYETARERDIPIFLFVDKNVLAEYGTYKMNRENKEIQYAHVDNVNIFDLLDDILAQRRNNFIRGFEKFDDISSWLRDQWAGLFADALSRKSTQTSLKNLSSEIGGLRQVSSVLREYSEAIIRQIKVVDSESIISEQQKKLRRSKIRRFVREAMISYIIDTNKESGEGLTSPARLFEAFEASTSVRDFLARSQCTNKLIEEISEFAQAKRDYKEIFARYVTDDDDNTVEDSDE